MLGTLSDAASGTILGGGSTTGGSMMSAAWPDELDELVVESREPMKNTTPTTTISATTPTVRMTPTRRDLVNAATNTPSNWRWHMRTPH